MPKHLKTPCFIFLLFLIPFTMDAQTLENAINLYGINFPQEKIHMHFDKEKYLPGETVWFKAYLFEENLPSERSTNFYAALYDEQGKLLTQQISPIFKGTTDGHFDLPDTLSSGFITCRAYTNWMLNFDSSRLFAHTIKVVNASASLVTIVPAKTTSLYFFPEGGSIIEGTSNTIAFKSNYNDGQPFEVNGVIKKQQSGEVITPLASLHDGMGKINLDIQAGDKYYAEWIDNNGLKKQSWLPDARPAGVCLKLAMQREKFYFNIYNKTGKDSLHILAYMYQKVFFKQDIRVEALQSYTGSVSVSGFPAGIMQLTVFDADWQPVAERVAFVNSDNFNFNGSLAVKQINTQKRGKNELEISVSDTIPANMSLSISDADFNNEPSQNTILSNLLLSSDLKGYIHNPAFYFSNAADQPVKEKLDLVMLTNGWRRYTWADMITHKMPALKYPPDEYLGVYGQVGKELAGKLDKDESITLMIKKADSTNSFYTVLPDKNGIVKQTGFVFYDSARVFYTFNKNKANNRQLAFGKYNFINQPPAYMNTVRPPLFPVMASDTSVSARMLIRQFQQPAGTFNAGVTLQEITLKAGKVRKWQNDPLVKLDEKYAKGLFAGGASGYALDVLHDDKAWSKLDVYQYLRTSMPGLSIGVFNNLAGRTISYNRRPVLIFIDEFQVREVDLENLDIAKVAYIKLIPFYAGSGIDDAGFELKAALSVYTRKGDDLIDRRPTEKDLGMVKIAGYTPLKEFYAPDYAETNANNAADTRTTLLWVPYIFTDKKTSKVPVIFYNNDLTRRMKIVLEGINEDGRMIRIEKILE